MPILLKIYKLIYNCDKLWFKKLPSPSFEESPYLYQNTLVSWKPDRILDLLPFTICSASTKVAMMNLTIIIIKNKPIKNTLSRKATTNRNISINHKNYQKCHLKNWFSWTFHNLLNMPIWLLSKKVKLRRKSKNK